ncbi:MAG: hypothetical protein WBD55_10905 [Dehalococcoidia bacterium]
MTAGTKATRVKETATKTKVFVTSRMRGGSVHGVSDAGAVFKFEGSMQRLADMSYGHTEVVLNFDALPECAHKHCASVHARWVSQEALAEHDARVAARCADLLKAAAEQDRQAKSSRDLEAECADRAASAPRSTSGSSALLHGNDAARHGERAEASEQRAAKLREQAAQWSAVE